MRKQLDRLYYITAVIGGFSLVAMTLLILTQIVGRWFGIIIPSTEDFSGYMLAASFSLCLGYTFRHGGLIRVSLLLTHLDEGTRFFSELLCMVLMTSISGFLIWYFGFAVYESYEYKDLSEGYIPVLIWTVQLPVLFGLLVLGIAVFDDFIELLSTRNPAYRRNEKSETDEVNLDESKVAE